MFIREGRFSSESVSQGHPDKLAGPISDPAPDAFPRRDPQARVACETLPADGPVVAAGEFRARDDDDFHSVRASASDIARAVLHDAGCRDAATGIDPARCGTEVRFNAQSGDISRGVDRADGVTAAGDQGVMFGYACDETPDLMPAPIMHAHRLVRRQAALRRTGALAWPGPDARSQVTFRYEAGRPAALDAMVLSTPHHAGVDPSTLEDAVRRDIIKAVIPQALRCDGTPILINPTGRFVTGGPKGATGLTGRRIIVDAYGGAAPHGGGAFSGKDPSRADRAAACMARFLAREAVARGWARRALVQLACATGVATPVNVLVCVDDEAAASEPGIAAALHAEVDLSPRGIMERPDLSWPIDYPTAAYGCLGRGDLDPPWAQAGGSSAMRLPADTGARGAPLAA
jgi:S-adenosylmethionine synthetase